MKTLTIDQIKSEAEQIINVSELKNLAFVVASKMIKFQGYYTCMYQGKKTFVTA